MKKMLLIMIQQRSAELGQVQSMDVLDQHLQLTPEEREEQLRLERQELELEQERVRQEAAEQLYKDQEQERLKQERAEQLARQEQLRLEQEKTHQEMLKRVEEEKRTQLSQNMATQLKLQLELTQRHQGLVKLRQEEQTLCTELHETPNPPSYEDTRWQEIQEYISWAAPSLAEYFKTGQSSMLNPELTTLLAPYVKTTTPETEEGEMLMPTKEARQTDLTKAKVPTVMVGNHSPKKRLKSKVQMTTAAQVVDLERRDHKKDRHYESSRKRSRSPCKDKGKESCKDRR